MSTIGGTAVSVNSLLLGSSSAEPVTTAIGGGVSRPRVGPAGAAVVLRPHRARPDQDHVGQLAQHPNTRRSAVGAEAAGPPVHRDRAVRAGHEVDPDVRGAASVAG